MRFIKPQGRGHIIFKGMVDIVLTFLRQTCIRHYQWVSRRKTSGFLMSVPIATQRNTILIGTIKVILETKEVSLASFKSVKYSNPRMHKSSNPVIIKKFITNSPDETKEVGLRLGRLLKPGDIVGLYGELGSGKTTLIKGIAKALGIENKDIASASFTIIAEYNTKPPFFHIDLYRIEKDTELDDLGFWDQIGGEGISVIEWAEKAGKRLPEEAIKVYLKDLGDDSREITIEGRNEQDRDNL